MSGILATATKTAIRLDEVAEENILLRRQVKVLSERISRSDPPESFGGYQDDWQELTNDEQIKEWADWSLEQAKKGGAG